MTKYKIIIDYGAYEGMKFINEMEYDTVDEAVKDALKYNSSFPFLIVVVVDWEAKEL